MPILLATDFSSGAQRAGDVAARLARALHEPLVVAHADGGAGDGGAVRTELLRLREIARMVEPIVRAGPVVDAVEATAAEIEPQLVVVGAHGAARRLFVGSVAEALAARLPLPVLVVRAAERLLPFFDESRVLQVLVADALDDTFPAARSALAMFAGIAHVHAVVAHCALPRREGPLDAQALRASIGRVPGADIEIAIDTGPGSVDERTVELARARDVDLVICGTHQRRGIERLLGGSVADGIVRGAPCSVLVAPLGARTEVSWNEPSQAPQEPSADPAAPSSDPPRPSSAGSSPTT